MWRSGHHFGRYVYAIGGNEQAARLSGIAVDRVKIAVYALSGLLASLAGVLYTAQYQQGKPDAGSGIELDAIAAVVIGGTSLMGGKGFMAVTLVGVLIFGFLGNILQLNNIDSNMTSSRAPSFPSGLGQPGRASGSASRCAAVAHVGGGFASFRSHVRCRSDQTRSRHQRGDERLLALKRWIERPHFHIHFRRTKMERRTLLKLSAALAATANIPRAFAAKRYRFGFSQATILETWRVQFNKDMRKEAEKHPDLELIIADGQNKTEKQVADVENFITQGVDVLLISPKESAGLTPAALKAIKAGIPVIILDRNVDTDKYTQFIGGDNVLIGRAAGEYTVKLLGGPGKAKGNIVELWGGLASAPAHDRSKGFHELVDKEPGIKFLLAPIDTEWKANSGYEIMATALKANEKIDLYAHTIRSPTTPISPRRWGRERPSLRHRRDSQRGSRLGAEGPTHGHLPLCYARSGRRAARPQTHER